MNQPQLQTRPCSSVQIWLHSRWRRLRMMRRQQQQDGVKWRWPKECSRQGGRERRKWGEGERVWVRAHLKQVQDANNGSLSRYKAREAEEERDTIELSAGQARPGWARARPGIPIGYTRCLSRKGERQRERGRWRESVPSSKGASDRSFDGSCCLLITRFLGNAMRCIANAGNWRSRGEGWGGGHGISFRLGPSCQLP